MRNVNDSLQKRDLDVGFIKQIEDDMSFTKQLTIYSLINCSLCGIFSLVTKWKHIEAAIMCFECNDYHEGYQCPMCKGIIDPMFSRVTKVM